ncbi:hypothetical protein AB6A40_005446 [Gnathostoma spinigerum]|uniref:Uncharacterized protein n=1 Tax=Gnathostoma spinigerum TaxID=75299 RepID=A0ABD6EPX9_9BILA
MEEREPNLVANTTHSISRKGVRRSELNDDELKHILKQLLALVRTDYILPPFHQSLNNAYKRGLLERSSSGDLLGQRYPDSRSPDINPDAHWFDQTVPKRHSAGPRLLAPYVMEARHQLRRLCGNSAEVMASWMSNASMNNEMDKHLSAFYINVHFGISDVVSNEQLVKIKERVRNLINANIWVKKALLCGCEYHRKCTIEQIRLCALRQLGLDENLISIEWETMTPAASFTNREASSSQSSLTFSTISNYVGTGVVQPGRNGKMECCQPDILQKECDISSLGCH